MLKRYSFHHLPLLILKRNNLLLQHYHILQLMISFGALIVAIMSDKNHK
ncbi:MULTISPECIES: putative holin-like toxin [Gracilibacillus]